MTTEASVEHFKKSMPELNNAHNNKLDVYLIEGLDATGKTTVVEALTEKLKAKGRAVLSISINNTTGEELMQKLRDEVIPAIATQTGDEEKTNRLIGSLTSMMFGGAKPSSDLISLSFESRRVELAKAFEDLKNAKGFDEKKMSQADLEHHTKAIALLKQKRLHIAHAAMGNLIKLSGMYFSDNFDVKACIVCDRYIASTVQFVPADISNFDYFDHVNEEVKEKAQWIQLHDVYRPVSKAFVNLMATTRLCEGMFQTKFHWIDMRATLKERQEFVKMRGGEAVGDKFEKDSFVLHAKMEKRIEKYWDYLWQNQDIGNWNGAVEFSPHNVDNKVMDAKDYVVTKTVWNNPRKPLEKVLREILA